LVWKEAATHGISPPPTDANWSVESKDDFSDQITVEALETQRGEQGLAFLARRSDQRLKPKLVSAALPPGFHIDLENAHMGFLGDFQEYAFMGDIRQNKEALELGLLAFHFTNPQGAPAVTVHCSGGRAEAVLSPGCVMKAGFPGILSATHALLRRTSKAPS
jgi:hypothetical protein